MGKNPETVSAVEDLGRVRLSRSFFMREFLYSEVAAIHGLKNVPDDPALAIHVGKKLCEELLEPLNATLGRIAIRSAFRSCEVNAFCNQMQKQGKQGYSCASTRRTTQVTFGIDVTKRVKRAQWPVSSFPGSPTSTKLEQTGGHWPIGFMTICHTVDVLLPKAVCLQHKLA